MGSRTNDRPNSLVLEPGISRFCNHSNFSEKNHEFTSRVTRITTDNCFPCWTNPNFVFDAGDWDWCPIWKGTDKQHICQKSITPQLVMSKIKPLLKK